MPRFGHGVSSEMTTVSFVALLSDRSVPQFGHVSAFESHENRSLHPTQKIVHVPDRLSAVGSITVMLTFGNVSARCSRLCVEGDLHPLANPDQEAFPQLMTALCQPRSAPANPVRTARLSVFVGPDEQWR